MRETGATYTETLAPAVIIGFERLAEAGIDLNSSFIDRANTVARTTLSALDGYDWENTDLPSREALIDGEPTTLSPKAYAEWLTVEAYQDAIILMDACIKCAQPDTTLSQRFMRRMGRGDHDGIGTSRADMRDLLINSKQTMLNRVLGLSDNSKTMLYRSMSSPTLAKAYLGIRGSSTIQLTEQEGQRPRLEWSRPYEQWIKENTDPSRGCPARNFVIETENGKQALTHYLWDQLVMLRFAEVEREDAALALGSAASKELLA